MGEGLGLSVGERKQRGLQGSLCGEDGGAAEGLPAVRWVAAAKRREAVGGVGSL